MPPPPHFRGAEMDADRMKRAGKLIEEALAAGLEGAEWCSGLGIARIAGEYNGIGPEFLPAGVRAGVTEWLDLFEPAAVIHDCRVGLSDGSRAAFLAANDEFRRNCLRLADRAYPWWSWRRWRARAVAQVLFDFVSADNFGWRAWREACARRG